MHKAVTLMQSSNTKILKTLYYILNREFLVKIKMLFLGSIEICISSREINLCRLDSFPIMVANRPSMYNRLPIFGLLCSCSYSQN